MGKVVVYTRASGGTAVCVPVISGSDPVDFTEADALDRALKGDIEKGATNIRVVDQSAIPTDRTYRNALKHDLTHDQDQCRSITVEIIAAKAMMDQRDATKAKAAREATTRPDIALAKTPEALKALLP